MSSFSEWETDTESYDEEVAIEAKRALAYLQSTRNYRYVEFLAQGGFGWVALVHDDDTARSLAIKCTTDTTEMEKNWWPQLDHPNILPLLEHITLDNCTVFIMPAMRKDLWMVINEKRFYDEELSFGLCRIWLRDVASALCYLHKQFLCHLDLKLDNIFLKSDGYACLGDFSLLSDIRKVSKDFHFLELYEPPEYTQWCHKEPPDCIATSKKFTGDKADIWQYGILAIDLLTNLKLSESKTSTFPLWQHDVWPLIEKILLHGDYLNFLLEDTFQNVVFKEGDMGKCHDLLCSILCLDPDERISAEEIRSHPFLNIEWPQLPKEFSLPTVIKEHPSKYKPLPSESVKSEGEVSDLPPPAKKESTLDVLDVMKMEAKKIQQEKIIRRESIAIETDKKLLEPETTRKATPFPNKDEAEKYQAEAYSQDDSEEETETTKSYSLGKKSPIKVTVSKKSEIGDLNARENGKKKRRKKKLPKK